MAAADTKVCCRCKQVKNKAEFYRTRRNKDGLCGRCTECDKAFSYAWKRKHRDEPRRIARESRRDALIRRCTRCKEEKHRSEFYVRRNGWPHSICKDCIKSSNSRYYAQNKVAFLAACKKYAVKNKNRIRERSKDYRKKNSIALSKQKREYYLANRPRLAAANRRYQSIPENAAKGRERARQWYQHHKHSRKHRQQRSAALARRRAKLHSLPAEFVRDDMVFALKHFSDCCAACGVAIGGLIEIHWDHWIPVDHHSCPGTVRWNMVPMCPACNRNKHYSMPMDWLIKSFGNKKSKKIFDRIEAFLKSRRQSWQ